jgi:tellurite resistance protein TerC
MHDIPHFSTEVWLITIAVLVGVILVDLLVHVRNHKEPSFKSASIQSIIYIVGAIGFMFFLSHSGLFIDGPQLANEFIAGYITEKSLSVDNLFVFLIIMTQFRVPRLLQSEALLIGIIVALILRGLFIWAGAAVIERFSWIFYIFGAFLIYTAYGLIKEFLKPKHDDAPPGGKLMDFIRSRFHTVDEFYGKKFWVKIDGKRALTPFFLVMVAIGFTDVLFALDSIPAIYGLTKEAYIVFTANAFALMGLRQLYFLLSGLMERLKYLNIGLSLILAWIGVKLIFHSLEKNDLPFINGGEKIDWLPKITIETSLTVIIVTITVTTIASLWVTRGQSGKKKTDEIH